MALSGTVEHATAFSLTGTPPDGADAWDGTGAHTVVLSGIASAAQGGIGIAFFTAAGPTAARTYTFPDADATILYAGGAVTATTNANLTGIVTSTGNATAIADKAISYTKLADGTDGNLITWDANGVAALVATGTVGQVLTSGGAGVAPTFAAAAAGALNAITAATGAVTIASGNNTGIVWNWANTTDATVPFTLGETTAATNGTFTTGVPNQVLLKLITLNPSTQSPLSVWTRGAHVFSVGTSRQILLTAGNPTTPPLSFSGAMSTGFYTTAAPDIGVTVNGVENSAFSAGVFQHSFGSASAVSYALNFRKSRGSVASPTVITTADDLATISGFGYVGATGTYVEGCRITFDSTGTIANTTSGLGGIMRLSAAIVGTVGVNEIAQVNGTEQHFLHVGTVPAITAGGGSGPSPTIAGTDEAFTVTVGGGGIATSVEVTFAKAFSVAPRCTANHQGAVLVLRCVSLVNKVTIDAATPFTAAGLIDVICRSGTT